MKAATTMKPVERKTAFSFSVKVNPYETLASAAITVEPNPQSKENAI